MDEKPFDVVVVGAGNAALCAALSAREYAERVLVIEKAPHHERGGNSFFSGGGFRFTHDGLEDVRKDVLVDMSDAEAAIVDLPGYSADQYFHDLMKVTENQSNEELVRTLIANSRDTVVWMRKHKVRWVPQFGRHSFLVGGRHKFNGGAFVEAVGGGEGLVTTLFEAAEKAGIEIRYATAARNLIQDRRGHVVGVHVRGPDGFYDIHANAVVLACGGFESNPEWRVRYLGPNWELCRVRGTRHNTGDGLRMALDIQAEPYGNWSSCHAVPLDYSITPFGDRSVPDTFPKYSYFMGIIVNTDGERFVDEGADIRGMTYAKYGREIMKQKQRMAFQIFDQKTVARLRSEYRVREATKEQADTLEDLAKKLDINPAGLARTVAAYNAACQPGTFNPAVLDGVHTEGLPLPKSNWALPIDTPPYVGFVTTCGITFTFGGVRINPRAEVQDVTDQTIPGLFVCGEMVGGIFYDNYPGGAGLMSGATFGRIAGRSAAQYRPA